LFSLKSLFLAAAFSLALGFAQVDIQLENHKKDLEANPKSSLAHYRIAEIFFGRHNYWSAANEYRDALNGDREPTWTEVWSHLSLGKIRHHPPARTRNPGISGCIADQ